MDVDTDSSLDVDVGSSAKVSVDAPAKVNVDAPASTDEGKVAVKQALAHESTTLASITGTAKN